MDKLITIIKELAKENDIEIENPEEFENWINYCKEKVIEE
jgi:hypothetical protein